MTLTGLWNLGSVVLFHCPQEQCFRVSYWPTDKTHGNNNSSEFQRWFGLVAQSCPTPCDPMDYSLPGSSVYGILQARILEWVAISFSRGSSQPRNRTQVSCIAGRILTNWAMREGPVRKSNRCPEGEVTQLNTKSRIWQTIFPHKAHDLTIYSGFFPKTSLLIWFLQVLVLG